MEYIYNKCLKIIESSNDKNIIRKIDKLKKSYELLNSKNNNEVQKFYSIVHELTIYEYINKYLNISICANNDDKAGPDFKSDLGYIECVSATIGDTETSEYITKSLNTCSQSINNNPLAERFTTCLYDKADKFNQYIEKKQIKLNIPRIIALSGSMFMEKRLNYFNLFWQIRRVLYGVEGPNVSFDIGHNILEENNKPTHSYNNTALKIKNNAILPIDIFSLEKFNDISAVIFTLNPINCDIDYRDLHLFINPLANIKVDESLLNGIQYYKRERKNENLYELISFNCN